MVRRGVDGGWPRKDCTYMYFMSSRWLSNSHAWPPLPLHFPLIQTASTISPYGFGLAGAIALPRPLSKLCNSNCARDTQSGACLKAKRTFYRWCNQPPLPSSSLGIIVPSKTVFMALLSWQSLQSACLRVSSGKGSQVAIMCRIPRSQDASGSHSGHDL